jgi:asparagine synthase (glutamine-hydrolysing)
MVSDVPIGAFLSGGIDSSVVTSIMAELSDEPVNTFTMGFKVKEYDERSRAKLIADAKGTRHHEYVLDYDEALKKINCILENMDEPFADSSVIPTYFISQFASQYVKVVLTGDAGDELFLGYSKYLINYYSDLFHRFPKWMQNCFRSIVLRLPDRTSLTRKLRKVLSCCDMELFEQRKELMSLGFKENERKKLLDQEYYSEDSMDFLNEIYHGTEGTEWTKTQYTDLTVVLEGDMLAKVDRMSMLHSLETRTPLLSREIVEFAYSLPDDFKIHKKDLKHIMKETFQSILPEGFSKLPKSGFGVPLDHWFQHELRGWVDEALNLEKIKRQGILNPDYVQEILQEHYEGKQNRKSEIWSLIVFQDWYERNIESEL